MTCTDNTYYILNKTEDVLRNPLTTGIAHRCAEPPKELSTVFRCFDIVQKHRFLSMKTYRNQSATDHCTTH